MRLRWEFEVSSVRKKRRCHETTVLKKEEPQLNQEIEPENKKESTPMEKQT